VPRRIAYTLRGAFVCESACGMLLGAQKSAGSCQTKRSISLLFIRSIAQRGNVTRIRYTPPHTHTDTLRAGMGVFVRKMCWCVCGGVGECGCVGVLHVATLCCCCLE